ncbi:hypothetical protein PTKIN_Ptkin12aG0101100 [Pterospermum kingtungense]
MPRELRRLFLLVYCEPSNMKKLWKDYRDAISKDFKRMNEDSMEIQVACTLRSIGSYLESMGKDINNYDLPKKFRFINQNK